MELIHLPNHQVVRNLKKYKQLIPSFQVQKTECQKLIAIYF